jgi:hypothetical protein
MTTEETLLFTGYWNCRCAANQGAATAPIEAAVNLDEDEQERLYAEYFNAQEGMRME